MACEVFKKHPQDVCTLSRLNPLTPLTCAIMTSAGMTSRGWLERGAITSDSDGVLQAHSTPSASRKYASFKQELLLQMGRCVKMNGADFAWKDHVEFTNGLQAAVNGTKGSDMTSELASMAAP